MIIEIIYYQHKKKYENIEVYIAISSDNNISWLCCGFNCRFTGKQTDITSVIIIFTFWLLFLGASWCITFLGSYIAQYVSYFLLGLVIIALIITCYRSTKITQNLKCVSENVYVLVSLISGAISQFILKHKCTPDISALISILVTILPLNVMYILPLYMIYKLEGMYHD